jgi:phycoerythrobilin:ferredoxin oxidoreductase
MATVKQTNNTTFCLDDSQETGMYRLFADYAWKKMLSVGLINQADVEYLTKDSVKPKPDSNFVRIHIVSAHPANDSVVRFARYALLETIHNSSDQPMCNYNGTHVLNFAIFPQPVLIMAIPILGIDLVTLPGGKNLCAIDFQPILHRENNKNIFKSWPNNYLLFEQELELLHSKLVKDRNLSWGGDFPEEARRFFSPYALWTRFKTDEGNQKLRQDIYPAFCAYVDLYIELLLRIQSEPVSFIDSKSLDEYSRGHSDYLIYRQCNDPARPMLRRLFGEDWAENTIRTRLFPLLENYTNCQ